MNAKIFFKLLFLIVILLFLVLMGMYNRAWVDFYLPPILPGKLSQPAAIMYFAFFAIGVLTGAVLVAGGGGGKKGAGNGKSNRGDK